MDSYCLGFKSSLDPLCKYTALGSHFLSLPLAESNDDFHIKKTVLKLTYQKQPELCTDSFISSLIWSSEKGGCPPPLFETVSYITQARLQFMDVRQKKTIQILKNRFYSFECSCLGVGWGVCAYSQNVRSYKIANSGVCKSGKL